MGIETEYQDIIRRIELYREPREKAMRFERFAQALEQLSLRFPPKGKGVFLIAGTNGKGTVAKTLECLLASEDHGAIGLFTSPHLMDTTERIRSFGRDLSREEFVRAFRRIEALADAFALSHFEILTLMMADVFFGGVLRPRVDRAVIEVGVGGRLDPTRMIPHEIAIVATLGLDHMQLLGPTLADIAREKLAITEGSRIVAHAVPAEEVHAEFASAKAASGADWIESRSFPYRVEHDGSGRPRWIIETPWGESALSLSGARAVENVSLALHALERVLADEGGDVKGRMAKMVAQLPQVKWPCRMEEFEIRGRRVFLSGDHNTQGAGSLREILSRHRYETLHVVAGFSNNKPVEEMLEIFASFPRARVAMTMSPFRPAGLTEFGGRSDLILWHEAGAERALHRALELAGQDDIILVTGSLYLAGFVRRKIFDGSFGAFTQP